MNSSGLNTKSNTPPTHPFLIPPILFPSGSRIYLIVTLLALNYIFMLFILDVSVLDLAYSLSAKIGKDFTKLTTPNFPDLQYLINYITIVSFSIAYICEVK